MNSERWINSLYKQWIKKLDIQLEAVEKYTRCHWLVQEYKRKATLKICIWWCWGLWTCWNFYTLSALTKINKNNIGLYKDDGLAVFKNISGPQAKKIKINFQNIFCINNLNIIVKCNLKIVDYTKFFRCFVQIFS